MNDELEGLLRAYHATLDPGVAEKITEQVAIWLTPFIEARVPVDAVLDIRQETLAEIAFNLVNINKGASYEQIRSWCFTIARRKIAGFFKNEKKRENYIQPLNPEEFLRIINADAATSWLSREAEQLRAREGLEILRRADPICFDMLWDRYVVGMSLMEMAEERYVSYDAMRMRVDRCRDGAAALLGG